MSERAQDHQEQEAHPRLVPNQDVQDQAPVHQLASPTAAAQRALKAPGKPAPDQVLALQKTVGNRAVQRLVQSSEGVVQRHFSAEQLTQAEYALADSMLAAHPGTGTGVDSESRMRGDRIVIEGAWREESAE